MNKEQPKDLPYFFYPGFGLCNDDTSSLQRMRQALRHLQRDPSARGDKFYSSRCSIAVQTWAREIAKICGVANISQVRPSHVHRADELKTKPIIEAWGYVTRILEAHNIHVDSPYQHKLKELFPEALTQTNFSPPETPISPSEKQELLKATM